MYVNISFTLPKTVVEAIIKKAKTMGLEFENSTTGEMKKKQFVQNVIETFVANNLGLTHGMMQDTYDTWIENNSDDFEDIVDEHK